MGFGGNGFGRAQGLISYIPAWVAATKDGTNNGEARVETFLIIWIAWVVFGQVIQAHWIKVLTVVLVAVIFWQCQGHRFIPVWAGFILWKIRIPSQH